LNGIVTLAPRRPIARPKVTTSSASAAGSGRYTASIWLAAKDALCIAGETECVIGDPTRP
jgi:hypothetical protein